jgi:hypothetical protein
MPGLTAGFSFARSSSHRAAVEHGFAEDPAAVVPAQQCCATGSGPCTGLFAAPSTATLAGRSVTCTGAYQYPWITVCRDVNFGGITAVASGCGFCWF